MSDPERIGATRDDASVRTVAIQGTHGSFSEAAAKWRWPDAAILPCREVRDAVAAVRDGRAEAGCLPIENSLFGSVTATYDLLHEAFGGGELHLADEILLPVYHALLAPPETALPNVRRVLSHPVALAQCRIWLEAHLPNADLVSEWDTAGSAEIVAREARGDQAAIAPLASVGAYGLAALAERIEDDPSNQTRFLTFTRRPPAAGASGASPARRKTSLLVWLPHKPGMLAAALQAFASRGVNLTLLQSRPERTAPFTYRFYIDVEGAPDEPRLAEAIEATEALVTKLVILGSYLEWNDGTAPSAAPTPPPAHHRPKPNVPLHDRRQRPEGTRVVVRGVEIGGDRPVLMAGPCSVEGEEMMLEVAASVAAAGADMLRGGAYKPRTSPYDFQGLGVRGLKFLAEARERTGLPVVTEVLSWEEVPVVARYADVLQIGARNMQNFALLRAAGRSGRPVLLKRGGGATVEEWLSAAEYILADGNEEVILCERGIRTFERATRHTLDLNGVALARERTHLPIIVDPSHAAGIRSIVAPLALAGLAAGAHGILVEVHPSPDHALSDGAQSLDLPAFAELARTVRGGRGEPETRRLDAASG
jgi:chorismate mutase/prephenate dehydratase